MAKTRDHYRYELKRGRKVVYRGITNDPERREAEHRQEGKNFSHTRIVGPAVTKETAQKWEGQSLASYRKSHGGKLPEYNEAGK
jgi:predicted GIY-YIG superfamily endonuclease